MSRFGISLKLIAVILTVISLFMMFFSAIEKDIALTIAYAVVAMLFDKASDPHTGR